MGQPSPFVPSWLSRGAGTTPRGGRNSATPAKGLPPRPPGSIGKQQIVVSPTNTSNIFVGDQYMADEDVVMGHRRSMAPAQSAQPPTPSPRMSPGGFGMGFGDNTPVRTSQLGGSLHSSMFGSPAAGSPATARGGVKRSTGLFQQPSASPRGTSRPRTRMGGR
mmetsp:Transcript_9937/g.15546  ORF Transcript_9937/g.15546 Transcript_9937/m.15546 type:complete len:163 (-) Transcript_9937:59-547(-)